MQSNLELHGYAVAWASTGAATLERARSAPPDLFILNNDLRDLDAVDLCRSLRQEPLIRRSTPIVMITTGQVRSERRLAALRAGAWDFLTFPFDPQELALKLNAYVGAKFDADSAEEEGLLDSLSGLYNRRGLERRARELTADGFRRRAALACVVLRVQARAPGRDEPRDAGPSADAISQAAQLLQAYGRASDVVGREEGAEFAVIAPATDHAGAAALATRLTQAIETSPARPGMAAWTFDVRAGYDAVADCRAQPTESAELLAHAAAALRVATTTNQRLQAYQGP